MSNLRRASAEGLMIVDRARQRRGWTKTSTARWWQDAHTSRATMRRFWQGDRIQQEIFIALCQGVGITDWEAIAASDDPSAQLPDGFAAQLVWDEAPDLDGFYGRNDALHQLEEWILVDRCKVVAIAGMAGIGKTTLGLALADRLQTHFEGLIWKSLATAPSLLHLLDSLLHITNGTAAETVQEGTAQLLHHLQHQRCLLVLDGLDAVLQKKETAAEYDQFLQQMRDGRHQSCILITSREIPAANVPNTKTGSSLNTVRLRNLDSKMSA